MFLETSHNNSRVSFLTVNIIYHHVYTPWVILSHRHQFGLIWVPWRLPEAHLCKREKLGFPTWRAIPQAVSEVCLCKWRTVAFPIYRDAPQRFPAVRKEQWATYTIADLLHLVVPVYIFGVALKLKKELSLGSLLELLCFVTSAWAHSNISELNPRRCYLSTSLAPSGAPVQSSWTLGTILGPWVPGASCTAWSYMPPFLWECSQTYGIWCSCHLDDGLLPAFCLNLFWGCYFWIFLPVFFFCSFT